MCGIIAYKGPNDASKIALEGLRSLEYRGYDSWGIATLSGSKINVVKDVGKISSSNVTGLVSGNTAIAHTRWATHGGVTKENAHPHIDCSGDIAVVHNGIIENYQELKAQLLRHRFVSETDTELIPHLIEEKMGGGASFEDAARDVARLLKGRSAFIAIKSDSGNMVAVRKGTPLIVGAGDGEFFIASDINAFFTHTKKVMYLDENELVIIGNDAEFFNISSGERV